MIEIKEFQKTEDKIHSELLADVPKKYQKFTGTFFWDTFKAIAAGFKIIYDLILKSLNYHDVDTLSGETLHKRVKQLRGIEWKEPKKSSGYLILKGNLKIYKNDMFLSDSGISFEALEDANIDGETMLLVQCTQDGNIGNVGANTINRPVQTLSGLESVTNPESFTNGYDGESDEDLLARYYEDLKIPLTSGNKYYYKKWVKEVAGVKEARVFPLWNGNNTVKIVIMDTNYSIINDTLVNDVQNYIDPYVLKEDGTKYGWGFGNGQAPNGSYCTVCYADILYLDISLSVEKTAGKSEDMVRLYIKNAIDEYLKSISFVDDEDGEPMDKISYAKIGAVILDANGVLDHGDLIINGLKSNIAISDTEFPKLRNLEINFINQETT